MILDSQLQTKYILFFTFYERKHATFDFFKVPSR